MDVAADLQELGDWRPNLTIQCQQNILTAFIRLDSEASGIETVAVMNLKWHWDLFEPY